MAPLWGSVDQSADEPKFKTTLEGMDSSNFTVFGVDDTEVGVARAASSAYTPAHGGWVGITSYTDMHGNLRVKSEVLCAINIASGDQADDAKFADS
ncbi:MAG: hypothetical protein CMA57_01920 [Euryarchaeota archaeon]|nr:hypothetical protein [Euryarchaeota archaeon]|tara:strand:- start:2907 stop:3194 length:288 start_codon:yes stop_codon:yes gene_type:complete